MRGVGIGMWGLRMNPEAKRMKQKTNKKTKKKRHTVAARAGVLPQLASRCEICRQNIRHEKRRKRATYHHCWYWCVTVARRGRLCHDTMWVIWAATAPCHDTVRVTWAGTTLHHNMMQVIWVGTVPCHNTVQVIHVGTALHHDMTWSTWAGAMLCHNVTWANAHPPPPS